MAHEVERTQFIVDTFLEELKYIVLDEDLYEELEKIMRTRAKGWKRVKQAQEFGMGLSTVDDRIKTLKEKYDVIQSSKPELGLPKRKHSKEEDEMDKQ